jgi:hypothetical protein
VSTVLITLLFLLNALLMPLVVELVKERAPGLALRVIRLAVRLLPRAHRDRYREEWTAERDEMERQNVSQIVSSLRILLGALSTGWILRKKKQDDAVTQLVRNFAQIHPDSSPLVHEFAQLQINQISQFLKGLSEGVGVSYDGEDREWLLGLTMQSRHAINAISLCTAHIDGEDFDVDGGLWDSDLGQRYLALQRDAMRRDVVIRRVFVIDQPGQANQDNLLRVCRQQRDLGIHVKIIDQSAMPDAIKSVMLDFIVFDNAISYEVLPASRNMKPTTFKTHLVLQPERVKERTRQFETFWPEALDVY